MRSYDLSLEASKIEIDGRMLSIQGQEAQWLKISVFECNWQENVISFNDLHEFYIVHASTNTTN